MFFGKSYAKKSAGVPALSEEAGPEGEASEWLSKKVKTAFLSGFAYNLKC